jgi:hypothetical protein
MCDNLNIESSPPGYCYPYDFDDDDFKNEYCVSLGLGHFFFFQFDGFINTTFSLVNFNKNIRFIWIHNHDTNRSLFSENYTTIVE